MDQDNHLITTDDKGRKSTSFVRCMGRIILEDGEGSPGKTYNLDCVAQQTFGTDDDAAKPTTVPSFSRCMNTMFIGCSVGPQPPNGTPLMQRFLREVGAKKPDGSSYDTNYFPIPTQNNAAAAAPDDAGEVSKQE